MIGSKGWVFGAELASKLSWPQRDNSSGLSLSPQSSGCFLGNVFHGLFWHLSALLWTMPRQDLGHDAAQGLFSAAGVDWQWSMCSYVGASCALPLALEASGQAVARCVTNPRCSRGFSHE